MTDRPAFSGFTKETVKFFNGIKRHNTRDWFAANRATYDGHVLAPAQAFVVAMGERLRAVVPHIVAVPQINKSIFRLNRDTRFSSDPSPYKTNLGIYFWEGPRSRMESPGFYFNLEPPDLMIGGGAYMFPDFMMSRFRRAAVDAKLGKELGKIVADIKALPEFYVGGEHYKRVPAGYDAGHPNAELLKHNGLYAGSETKIPDELFSVRLLDYCFERFEKLLPLHKWLMKLT